MSTIVNTREAREARDAVELAEMEKARTDAAVAAANPQTPETPAQGFQGHNWEQRYNDLRSYSSKREAEFNKRIKALEDQVSQTNNSAAMPSTPDEFKAWADEFPDLVRMLRTAIRMETDDTIGGNVKSLQDRIKDLEYELTKERASGQLIAAHSDAFKIINDPEFVDWLETQRNTRGRVGQAMWDALNTDDFDVSAAADAITQYKTQKTPKRQTEQPQTTRREAAFVVPSGNRAVTPMTSDGKRIYTEDEIGAMSPREFDKLEADIDLAWKEGRIMTRRQGAAF